MHPEDIAMKDWSNPEENLKKDKRQYKVAYGLLVKIIKLLSGQSHEFPFEINS